MARDKVLVEDELKALEVRWQEEVRLVGRIQEIRQQLEAQAGGSAAKAPEPGLRSELSTLSGRLRELQSGSPLVQVCVDAQTVAAVVSTWTGIPIGRMLTDEINTLLNLQPRLEERIIGQSHAVEAIAQCVRTERGPT